MGRDVPVVGMGPRARNFSRSCRCLYFFNSATSEGVMARRREEREEDDRKRRDDFMVVKFDM